MTGRCFKYRDGDGFVIARRAWKKIERFRVPGDEYDWAATPGRLEELHAWYRFLGLHRGAPHPMGKDLGALMREYRDYHAERYRKAGMEVPGCYLRPPSQLTRTN